MEQTESSLDALERLMAVPSNTTSLEEEEANKEEEEGGSNPEEKLTMGGGTPKDKSHEAVLRFR